VLLSANLFFFFYDRKNAILSLIISLSPLITFLTAMLLLSPDAFIHDLSFNYRRLGVMGSDELNSGGQSIWDVMLLLLVILLLAVFVAVIYRNRVKIVDVYIISPSLSSLYYSRSRTIKKQIQY